MDSIYQPLREKLAAALCLSEQQENSIELDSLVADIEREIAAWKNPETKRLVLSASGGRYEKAVKMLVMRGAGSPTDLVDYAKVFPELLDDAQIPRFSGSAAKARSIAKTAKPPCVLPSAMPESTASPSATKTPPKSTKPSKTSTRL